MSSSYNFQKLFEPIADGPAEQLIAALTNDVGGCRTPEGVYTNHIELNLLRYQLNIDETLNEWHKTLHETFSNRITISWPKKDEEWFEVVKIVTDACKNKCVWVKTSELKMVLTAVAGYNGFRPRYMAHYVMFEYFIRQVLNNILLVTNSKGECVVCYEGCNTTTTCNHRLCNLCLRKLKIVICPYCRRELHDEDQSEAINFVTSGQYTRVILRRNRNRKTPYTRF